MDDLEMEQWMELTDDQQEAIVAREYAAYERRLARLSIAEQYAYFRGNSLRSCLQWRRLSREQGFDFGQRYVRSAQRRLLALRIWRATGTYPGEA